MSHSGCNGGKKWRVIIKEKFGCSEAVIFDSGSVYKGDSWLRPTKAMDEASHFLEEHNTFDFEGYAIRVIGKVFNRPLFFKRKKNE